MSCTINNKSHFIDSFQFLSSSLDSLVKNLSKNDFKYFSQEFDDVLDLVNQKWFYPYCSLLFTDTDSLMYECTPKMFMKILTVIKKSLTLTVIWPNKILWWFKQISH